MSESGGEPIKHRIPQALITVNRKGRRHPIARDHAPGIGASPIARKDVRKRGTEIMTMVMATRESGGLSLLGARNVTRTKGKAQMLM